MGRSIVCVPFVIRQEVDAVSQYSLISLFRCISMCCVLQIREYVVSSYHLLLEAAQKIDFFPVQCNKGIDTGQC